MRNRTVLPVLAVVLGTSVLSGCTGGSHKPAGTPPSESESGEAGSVPPSVAREVPPDQRMRLTEASPDRMCGLVTPRVLEKLAFPVGPGSPREVGVDPPVRGCVFEAREGTGSVLVGSQPDGFDRLGVRDVDLGEVRASKTRHVNDCTVFADVAGSTLQVTVTADEAGPEQCESAASVARYVLEGLAQ